jgi:hypothetical protein
MANYDLFFVLAEGLFRPFVPLLPFRNTRPPLHTLAGPAVLCYKALHIDQSNMVRGSLPVG